MTISRRRFMQTGAAGASATMLSPLAQAAPAGPFKPEWESLAQHYATPDWFRDAKFGIWAHWGPQCQPENGDWYARLMYMQGEDDYDHHLKNYGHPTKTGFMDIINRWKVDEWNPDRLMGLYKQAGAQYFVALAAHHDNFDTFNSKHHPWNATSIGPKRDLVGEWAKATRAHGLRFGVSNHASHAWHWLQTAYGYDAEGPMAGQRYDAFRLTRQDGAGTWWEGLDPQELYTGANMIAPDGLTSIKALNDWHGANDGQWLEMPPPHNRLCSEKWLARCKDLTDKYQPDYVYFDDTSLPLGQYGLDAVAHYYNAAWARTGHSDVVVTAKKLTPLELQGIVEDVERGFSPDLKPHPWQTCTCIGNWHYDRRIFERHGYVPAKGVLQRLIDTVSKNGNLLLSIPVRGNGAIDADEEQILADLGAWMKVNGEAIFASRPWHMYGEGPTKLASGAFGEVGFKGFTGSDIRFTVKGDSLYLFLMAWPDAGTPVTVQALAGHGAGRVERVELLGGDQIAFEQRDDGLLLHLDGQHKPAITPVLRVRGRGLV